MKIGIVDYNMGNLASVINAFKKVGVVATLEKDINKLKEYDKLILPGVGAFGDAMLHLKERNMDEAIKDFVKTERPLLGICLGMQLLFESSQEFGEQKGLELIEGKVVPFDKSKFEKRLKIPHMGWNELFKEKESKLFYNLPDAFYLYFVHSFHIVSNQTIGKTIYGYEFTSAVEQNNIYGIQPHPEKSHKNGLQIIENFAKLA